jgi:hypothetical protein
MRQPRWAVLLLFLAGFGLLFAGLFLLRAPDTTAAGQPAAGPSSGLPDRLGRATATNVQTGQAAMSTIESLHGHGFALTDAAVAQYGGATVWVAQSRDEQGAADMTAAMQKRIAVTNSPFTPEGTREIGSWLVYVLSGMGQAHFYWQAGDKVVWLAAPLAEAEQDVADLVRAVK